LSVVVRVAAAPNVGGEVREEYLRHYEGLLPKVEEVVFIVVLTGGAEPEVLSQAGRFNVLLAWPHYNSLPSALEAAAALRERGAFAEVVALDGPGAEPPAERVRRLVEVARLLDKPPRLMLVGEPNPWLVASDLAGKPDVRVDEEEVYRRSLSMQAAEEARRLVESARESAYGPGELERVLAYAKALREAARGVDGLTLGCWCFNFPKVEERGWTPCISLAVLNDWGVTATCEGDLRALYSAVVLRRISGKPAWISNVNAARGELLLLTHDGLPPSMAKAYSIVPRLATKAPAAIRAEVEPGRPVTLLRVSRDLRRALLLGGVTAEAERAEACATQIAVKVTKGSPAAVYKAGLGNHLAFVFDDVYEEVEAYLRYLGASVLTA